jgi:hypothetical protein
MRGSGGSDLDRLDQPGRLDQPVVRNDLDRLDQPVVRSDLDRLDQPGRIDHPGAARSAGAGGCDLDRLDHPAG